MDYDPETRLGSGGLSQIKSHDFFKDLDWDNLNEMEPPFVPQVQNEIDTTFFADDKKFDVKDLQEIQNDMDNYSTDFQHFDSTVFNTLVDINKKEAERAIIKANALQKENSEIPEMPGLVNKISEYKFDDLLG